MVGFVVAAITVLVVANNFLEVVAVVSEDRFDDSFGLFVVSFEVEEVEETG